MSNIPKYIYADLHISGKLSMINEEPVIYEPIVSLRDPVVERIRYSLDLEDDMVILHD